MIEKISYPLILDPKTEEQFDKKVDGESSNEESLEQQFITQLDEQVSGDNSYRKVSEDEVFISHDFPHSADESSLEKEVKLVSNRDPVQNSLVGQDDSAQSTYAASFKNVAEKPISSFTNVPHFSGPEPWNKDWVFEGVEPGSPALNPLIQSKEEKAENQAFQKVQDSLDQLRNLETQKTMENSKSTVKDEVKLPLANHSNEKKIPPRMKLNQKNSLLEMNQLQKEPSVNLVSKENLNLKQNEFKPEIQLINKDPNIKNNPEQIPFLSSGTKKIDKFAINQPQGNIKVKTEKIPNNILNFENSGANHLTTHLNKIPQTKVSNTKTSSIKTSNSFTEPYSSLSGVDFVNAKNSTQPAKSQSVMGVGSEFPTLSESSSEASVSRYKNLPDFERSRIESSHTDRQQTIGSDSRIEFMDRELSKVPAKVAVTGHVVKGSMSKDRFSHEAILNFSKGVQHLSSKGGGEMTIRLKPESLGELKMKVSTAGDQVGLKIQASNGQAKKVLEDSISYLKEGLSQQKLNLKNFDISIANRSISENSPLVLDVSKGVDTSEFGMNPDSSKQYFDRGTNGGSQDRAFSERDLEYSDSGRSNPEENSIDKGKGEESLSQKPLRRNIWESRIDVIA